MVCEVGSEGNEVVSSLRGWGGVGCGEMRGGGDGRGRGRKRPPRLMN